MDGRETGQWRELAHLAQASDFATRAAKTGMLDLAQAHAGWADTLAQALANWRGQGACPGTGSAESAVTRPPGPRCGRRR